MELEPFLTPATFGEGGVRLLTDPGCREIEGFHISGKGLAPISE